MYYSFLYGSTCLGHVKSEHDSLERFGCCRYGKWLHCLELNSGKVPIVSHGDREDRKAPAKTIYSLGLTTRWTLNAVLVPWELLSTASGLLATFYCTSIVIVLHYRPQLTLESWL
jgi:hypothetical protein